MKGMNVLNDDIGNLIKKISIPASTGYIFITLFNVTDTIFASLVSTDAVAGLTLSFPIFFIIVSIGGGFGSGLTALISNAIGENNINKGLKTAYDALKIHLILSFIVTLAGLLALPHIFKLMKAETLAYNYGIAYTNIIIMGTIFFIMNSLCRGILEAEGNTKPYRNFLIAGFLLNIPLDYFFIKTLNLGTAGVAYATILVQSGGMIYLIYMVLHSQIMTCCLKEALKLKQTFYRNILGQGIPASLNMMSIALGVFIINYFVNRYGGSSAIAAYGIAIRIEQITLLPTIGINIAVLSLTGQNFGARNMARVIEIYKTALKYGLALMTIAMLIIYPFAEFWMGLFSREAEVIKIGSEYMRIDVFVFFSYVLLNTSLSIQQGMKKPIFALFVGIYRQFIMPLLVFSFFVENLGFGLNGIWYGVLVINWSAVIVTLIYTRYVVQKVIK